MLFLVVLGFVGNDVGAAKTGIYDIINVYQCRFL